MQDEQEIKMEWKEYHGDLRRESCCEKRGFRMIATIGFINFIAIQNIHNRCE